MNNIDIYLTTEEVHIERDVDRKRKIVELKNCTPKNLLYNWSKSDFMVSLDDEVRLAT